MKKTVRLFLVVLFITSTVVGLFPVRAGASVNYNRLIDDLVFSNSSKMTADQIDSFLNSFPNSCISTHKGFKAPDPTGYNPTDGFLYGSNVTAGRVIYDAAQAYDLNPQVLLTTIQKEQTYISGPGTYDCTNPLSTSAKKGYTQIVGYGCPDGGVTYNYSGVNLYTIGSTTVTSVSGTCVNSKAKAGFSQQIIHAAWLLKFGQQRSLGNTSWAIVKGNWNNSDDPDSCYGGPMTQGYRKRCASDASATYYDGYTTIDGSSVHMDTGATASLYWYTPHKSGNQNFVDIFSGWFGNPATDTTKDLVLVGDWNHSGLNTAAIRRGNIFYFDNNNDGELDKSFSYGRSTDKVITGDWNGDGYTDIGLRRDKTYFLYDNKNNVPYKTISWGRDTDTVFAGKWNGTNYGLGLKRGKYFFLDYNNDGVADDSFSWGRDTDNAVIGNWDGDTKTDIGLRRGNIYFFDTNQDGNPNATFSIGRSTDSTVVGDWDSDGSDEIGLRRGQSYFLNYNNDSTVNRTISWGRDSDRAIVGDWNGDGQDSLGLKRASDYYLDNNNDGTSDLSYVYTY